MEFTDGSNPSEAYVANFVRIVEHEADMRRGSVMVHCRAGLGRTGTMIACYLVYKHEFDAKEAIAWTRLCRPGSVVGQQQQFILDLEPKIGNLVKVSKPKRDYTEYKAGREKVKHCQKKPAENPYKKEVLFKPGKFSANMDALYDEIN